jgi:dipeptidyl aminopeptidase/acylaminoacyl peptidase
VLNLPRLRALALFGRRPPQRVDRPASRQPKTSTKQRHYGPSSTSQLHLLAVECPKATNVMAGYKMFEAVEFPSEGVQLRGRFYRPERAAPFPTVIMSHGTTATISMALSDYALVFCRAGLAVLLYDHRNFGGSGSGGEPRQQINPWIQARGYRDALDYLLTRNDVRADRIAAWGDSYSGMIALLVGALDPRFAAVAVQCPTLWRGKAEC